VEERFTKNIQRMQRCLHFISCEAVRCPLDDFMSKRVKLPEDKGKCVLRRSMRLRFGRDMVSFGLWPLERAALVRAHGCLETGVRAILSRNFRRNEILKSRKRHITPPCQHNR